MRVFQFCEETVEALGWVRWLSERCDPCCECGRDVPKWRGEPRVICPHCGERAIEEPTIIFLPNEILDWIMSA